MDSFFFFFFGGGGGVRYTNTVIVINIELYPQCVGRAYFIYIEVRR